MRQTMPYIKASESRTQTLFVRQGEATLALIARSGRFNFRDVSFTQGCHVH